MSAAEALQAAEAAGVEVRVEGDDLVLEATAPPSAVVLGLLALHKSSIVTLLRRRWAGWSEKEWQAFFYERAGIAEFDGGLCRTRAEVLAFTCCIAEWLKRNPVWSSPGRCLGCGASEHREKLLPFGTEDTGHAWLHPRCWPIWCVNWTVEAAAALRAIGITPPPVTG